MIKKYQLVLLLVALCIINNVSAQVRPDIARIYEDAERLYRSGNYSASLEYLKREGGDWMGTSDTLMYMKIKNLDNLYRSDFAQTKDLEATFQRFFARVNKNTFPELKYSEVTTVYTTFLGFKERDKAFYDSVARVIDLNKSTMLIPLRQQTTDYLKAYPNTYYSTQLNGYINDINVKLTQLELARKKHERDSLNRRALKQVGQTLVLNLTYSIPSGGQTHFAALDNQGEVNSFYNGTYAGSLGEKYSIGASLAEAFINIYTGTRVKFSLNWSIFDAEYTVFDWSANSLMSEKQTTNEPIKELKSIKAGTRIGPVVTVLATRSIAISLYYSARPGIQFLTGKGYYNVANGATTTTYEVKPVLTNFNFSNEFGMKFYFFRRVFICPYIHIGKFNWQSEIADVTSGSASDPQNVQANYDFKFIGVRLGF